MELQDNGKTCSVGVGGVIGGLTDTLPTFVNHGSQFGLVTGSGLVEQKLNHSFLHQYCDDES